MWSYGRLRRRIIPRRRLKYILGRRVVSFRLELNCLLKVRQKTTNDACEEAPAQDRDAKRVRAYGYLEMHRLGDVSKGLGLDIEEVPAEKTTASAADYSAESKDRGEYDATGHPSLTAAPSPNKKVMLVLRILYLHKTICTPTKTKRTDTETAL